MTNTTLSLFSTRHQARTFPGRLRPALLYPILLLCLSALGSPPGAAADSKYVSLRMKEDALIREMSSGKSMLLPEFEVYDSSGYRIHHSYGLPADFRETVHAALGKDEKEDVRLSDRTSTLESAEGQPIQNSLFSNMDYVFVEYWAEWCSACFQQMTQVEKIIQDHPESRILWLKVEKDPTKLESMQIRMEKSGIPTSSAK